MFPSWFRNFLKTPACWTLETVKIESRDYNFNYYYGLLFKYLGHFLLLVPQCGLLVSRETSKIPEWPWNITRQIFLIKVFPALLKTI